MAVAERVRKGREHDRAEYDGSRRFRIPTSPYAEGWHVHAVVLNLLWVSWIFPTRFFGPSIVPKWYFAAKVHTGRGPCPGHPMS